MKLVAKVFIDKGNQGFNLFGFECVGAGAFENVADVAGLEEGEVMPTLEVSLDPGGNGGEKFAEGAGERVGAESG